MRAFIRHDVAPSQSRRRNLGPRRPPGALDCPSLARYSLYKGIIPGGRRFTLGRAKQSRAEEAEQKMGSSSMQERRWQEWHWHWHWHWHLAAGPPPGTSRPQVPPARLVSSRLVSSHHIMSRLHPSRFVWSLTLAPSPSPLPGARLSQSQCQCLPACLPDTSVAQGHRSHT